MSPFQKQETGRSLTISSILAICLSLLTGDFRNQQNPYIPPHSLPFQPEINNWDRFLPPGTASGHQTGDMRSNSSLVKFHCFNHIRPEINLAHRYIKKGYKAQTVFYKKRERGGGNSRGMLDPNPAGFSPARSTLTSPGTVHVAGYLFAYWLSLLSLPLAAFDFQKFQSLKKGTRQTQFRRLLTKPLFPLGRGECSALFGKHRTP